MAFKPLFGMAPNCQNQPMKPIYRAANNANTETCSFKKTKKKNLQAK
jgi:hypothetical protein